MAQVKGREPLSRERILSTALELARRDGPDALSMRRIATELDVWPMSLYRHFRDKDELLDALAGEAAHDIAAPEGASWREDMTALLRQARDAFAAHPAGVRLHREPSLREAGLAILARAGVDDGATAWGALVAFAAHPAGVRLHREPSLREAGLAILARAGVSDDEAASAWGALVAFAAGAAAVDADDAAFEHGVALLLDGLG